MISGLESTILKPSDLELLEQHHKTTVKMLQGLPKRTANEAVYLLAGIQPIEAILHLRFLSLFGAICIRKNSTIWQIAVRQVAMKSSSSNSWFINIMHLLEKYNLPDPIDLLCNPRTKQEWKKTTKMAVFKYWDQHLKETAVEKSSLKHVIWNTYKKPTPHRIWAISANNINVAHKAYIKAKLMVHVYGLQKRMDPKRISSCPVCASDEREDEIHFVANCCQPDMIMVRSHYIDLLVNSNLLTDDIVQRLKSDDNFLTQLI